MKKLDYNYVKKYIEGFGYKLLSKEYINYNTKLQLQCPVGHIFQQPFKSFKKGYRCASCSNNKKLTIDLIKNNIEKENYFLLSTEYKNAITKLQLQCPVGHIFWMNYNNFKTGKRCKKCSYIKRGYMKKLPYKEIKNNIEKINGYKLLSKEYKNARSKLKIKCDKNHIYESTWYNLKSGYRCPICYAESKSSKAEKEIQNYIKNNFKTKLICNDRTQILNEETGYYLELDVWLPNLNKAIEYNGVFWHSLKKSKINDKIKKYQCRKLKIDLLIINEKDWNKNKTKILQQIDEFIGK